MDGPFRWHLRLRMRVAGLEQPRRSPRFLTASLAVMMLLLVDSSLA
jgi:hypothetical protein